MAEVHCGKERRIINSLKQILATVGSISAGGEMTPQAIFWITSALLLVYTHLTELT